MPARVRMMRDPRVYRSAEVPVPYTMEHAQWRFDQGFGKNEDFTCILDDIWRVGFLCCAGGELGYVVDPRAWGRGVGTWMVREFMEKNGDDIELKAKVLETNTASCRILERTGFDMVDYEPHKNPNWPPYVHLRVYFRCHARERSDNLVKNQ